MLVRRPRPPIIPSNTRDRTGAGAILRRAGAAIRKRFDGLRSDVLAIFASIPVYATNDDTASVRYGATPETLARLAEELQAALERWLGEGLRSADGDSTAPPVPFWWDRYAEEAAQLGATQTFTNLSGLSPTYAASRSLIDVLFGAAFLARVAAAQFQSREYWTGLAAEQRARLAQLIGRVVADGTASRQARRLIAEQLGTGTDKALAYALSAVTDTVRMARVAEAEAADADFGIKTALLWASALIPTTRPWHASRHGRTYTPSQVREFYAEGGNRYNCRCMTTEVLLDDEGKPVMPKKSQEKMATERKRWQSAFGGRS